MSRKFLRMAFFIAAGVIFSGIFMRSENEAQTRSSERASAHPNERVVREMFAAYGRGDTEALKRIFAEDVIYHIPGRNDFSKDYRGRKAIFELFERQKKRMDGRPYKVEIIDLLVSENHVVALTRVEAEGAGKSATWRGSNVYRLRAGRIAEAWFMLDDLYAYDRFWTEKPGE
jgi:uncharacterized protein